MGTESHVKPPTSIQADKDKQLLLVQWPDGHQSRYPFKHLRENCSCALCVHELTGERLLDPASIPADIHVQNMNLVGNYAVKIQWSDGHDTGLFAWDRLRQLCQCDQCVESH